MVPCVFLYCHLGSAAPGRVLMAYAEVGQAIFQSIGVSTIYVQLYSRSTWTGMFFSPSFRVHMVLWRIQVLACGASKY